MASKMVTDRIRGLRMELHDAELSAIANLPGGRSVSTLAAVSAAPWAFSRARREACSGMHLVGHF